MSFTKQEIDPNRVLTIPKSSLGYETNNIYPQFPPLMSDGRSLVSNWQPDAIANQAIVSENKIVSNWEYRKYLTHNAKQIMELNLRETANDTGYMNTQKPTKESNVPLWFPSLDDKTPMSRSSDLKDLYMLKVQSDSKKGTWST